MFIQLDCCGCRLGAGVMGPLRKNGSSWLDPLRYGVIAMPAPGYYHARLLWFAVGFQGRRDVDD